jgi:hypothetical protein
MNGRQRDGKRTATVRQTVTLSGLGRPTRRPSFAAERVGTRRTESFPTEEAPAAIRIFTEYL